MKKLLVILIAIVLFSSCATSSLVDTQTHCHHVKYKKHKMVKCSYNHGNTSYKRK